MTALLVGTALAVASLCYVLYPLFRADIAAGRVGPDQATPKRERKRTPPRDMSSTSMCVSWPPNSMQPFMCTLRRECFLGFRPLGTAGGGTAAGKVANELLYRHDEPRLELVRARDLHGCRRRRTRRGIRRYLAVVRGAGAARPDDCPRG